MATTKSTISSSRDYYSGMPDWQQEQLVGDAAWETEFRDQMSKVAGDASKDPRKVLGLSGGEKQAVKDAGAATDWATGQNKSIMAGINNAEGPAAGLVGVKDPSGNFKYVQGPKDADLDAIRAGYENQYTGDVVDTTLAGMQRAADRERLRRDAQSAAIGGTSNSRSAVADAVAQQLTGMNMAEMESKLRSDAFNTAADYGLKQADMDQQFNLSQAEFAKAQEDAARDYGLDVSDFSLEKAKADAAQGNIAADYALDKASALGNLTNAEYLRRYGLAGLEGSTAATGRELAQGQIDSDYYSGMNAGSWLADVYDTSRTRDSAPYNYSETGTETAKTKESGGDVWSKVAGAAAAGLSSAFG